MWYFCINQSMTFSTLNGKGHNSHTYDSIFMKSRMQVWNSSVKYFCSLSCIKFCLWILYLMTFWNFGSHLGSHLEYGVIIQNFNNYHVFFVKLDPEGTIYTPFQIAKLSFCGVSVSTKIQLFQHQMENDKICKKGNNSLLSLPISLKISLYIV